MEVSKESHVTAGSNSKKKDLLSEALSGSSWEYSKKSNEVVAVYCTYLKESRICSHPSNRQPPL